MTHDRPLPPTSAAPTDSGVEASVWGSQYLVHLRDRAVDPSWIAVEHLAAPPGEVLTWIGHHIPAINQQLGAILVDLLACFEPSQRPKVELFAAPLHPQAGIDGFCNLATAPITLMVDPGGIVPDHWPRLVAHELAHAAAQTAGHGEAFRRAIAHLCLGQDLPLPPPHLTAEGLSAWPPCRRRPQGAWLAGRSADLSPSHPIEWENNQEPKL